MAQTKPKPKTRIKRRYSPEFRQEAVQMLLDGHSGSSVAERLGLPRANLLYRWKKDAVRRAGPVAGTLGDRDFMQDEGLEGQDRILNKYLKPELLIVDDMGMKNLPRRAGKILFEIIMRRYETKSAMMTSNRPLEDWGKLIGDVPSATAILDRFLHHADVIAITGKSYRLRNQKMPPSDGDENSKPANLPTGSAARKKGKSGPDTPASEADTTCES